MFSPKLLSGRRAYSIAAMLCLSLIAVALLMQYQFDLEPCPLCVFQRLAVLALAIIFVVAALLNPRSWGRVIVGLLGTIVAALGLLVAGRQTWLQHLPEDLVPACGPGLDYMLELFPLKKVVDLVFRGSGECAEVQWTFLSLSIAEWMMIVFSAFILFCLWPVFASRRVSGPH